MAAMRQRRPIGAPGQQREFMMMAATYSYSAKGDTNLLHPPVESAG